MQVPYMDLKAQIAPLRNEIDVALKRIVDNCSFILGPDVASFEDHFSKLTGREHTIGVNSGTSALHLALLALDIGPGDEVITTPYTFAATSWGISYCGAKPVYVDIEPESWNMDPSQIEAAITEKTKAILPVHIYGHPADMPAIMAIANKHNLPVVEDAAQAHLAHYQDQMIGSFGAMTTYSFYPAKNLGAAGEGGAVVTDDPALAARVKSLRNHASTERYKYDEVGYNYRMEGIQGAILNIKLPHIQAWTDARRAVAHQYHELLADTPLQLPTEINGCISAYHLYTVMSDDRDGLSAHLTEQGIGNGMHYPIPLHLQKAYETLGYKAGDFPVTEATCERCLCIPMFAELTDAQVKRVAQVINDYFA